MAKVYRAFDRRLEVHRAIKVLSPAYAAHPEIRKRFLAEARTTARLAHPNIVMAHDIGADGDRLFIVMELVEGGSIWDRMRETGPLTPLKALEVMAALLPALSVAHEQGVIHRDIKPGNILVTRDGTYKLADFGIARVAETENTQTRTGSLLGTPAYMAPEQWNGSKELDGRADLFAMAATLYSLLTLQTPQDLHIPESQEEQLRGLPEAIRNLIGRAVRYRPTDRFASATDMLEAVHNAARRLQGQLPESRLFDSEPDARKGLGSAPPPQRPKSGGRERVSLLPEMDGAEAGAQLAGHQAPVTADEILRRARQGAPAPKGPNTGGLLDTTGRRRAAGAGAVVVEVPELKPDAGLFVSGSVPAAGPMTTGSERTPATGSLRVQRTPTTPSPAGTRAPNTAPTLASQRASAASPTLPAERPVERPSSPWFKAVLVILGLFLVVGGALVWSAWEDGPKNALPAGSTNPKPAQKPAVTLPVLSPDTPQGKLVVECRPDCAVVIDHANVGEGRVEAAVKAGRHMIGVGPTGARVNTTINVPEGETVTFCWDTQSRKRCAE